MGRLALAVSLLLLCSCPAEQPAEPQRPDPSLAALSRLVDSEGDAPAEGDLADCLARAERSTTCSSPAGGRRNLPLRIALDNRYAEHWQNWRDRLATTLACTNRLYRESGVSWTLWDVQLWEPGADRHNLRGLLRRLQIEFPPDLRSVVVGVSVWDERRVYARAGGEIGLSQRAACVVPSWPRIENDCLTLAHELGHIVGARHVRGKNYIMAWAGNLFFLPVGDAIARVVATHRFDPRNLAAIRIYHQARFTEHGLHPPAGCVERLRLMDRCWKL